MLVSFLALVALVNLLLGKVGDVVHVKLSLETILGYAFMPLALVMGVPWKDAFAVGDLLGTRMVLNELIAYSARGAQGDSRPAHLHDRHATPCAASPTSARSASRSAASGPSPPSGGATSRGWGCERCSPAPSRTS